MSEENSQFDPQNEHLKVQGEPGLGSEIAAFFWETIKIVVISLAIILPIRYYIAQPFFVKGASMESNFIDGDYIFIDELSLQFNDPNRGDVVIFRYPLDQSQFFIKRVIALPGETVEIKDNKVFIYNTLNPNGFLLKEPYLDPGQETLGSLRMKMDDSEYFVMGDNRLRSSDSRRWGGLDRTLITGRAFVRLWPFSRLEKISPVTYPAK